MPFQLVQIVYWLALSTWFGGVLFMALAAPVIFRTIGRRNPVLPDVLSVNLEGQHGMLLAAQVAGDLLDRLIQVALLCGGALLVAMIAQCFLIRLDGSDLPATIIRWVLFMAAVALGLYHWQVLSPRLRQARQEYIEHADEPEVANPARERFDREHARSVLLLQLMSFCLLGMIFFSASIMPRNAAVPAPPPAALEKR